MGVKVIKDAQTRIGLRWGLLRSGQFNLILTGVVSGRTPQGGPIYLVFWTIVMDEILRILAR